jgi:tripartite-type tricarboxylate transporter receptor subunit TctC
MLRHVTTLLSLCTAIMLAVPVAAQQAYPSKPVRLIVPFPPGGANDIVARLIGQRLNDRWARVVVIDNRGGAGGNIGTEIGRWSKVIRESGVRAE